MLTESVKTVLTTLPPTATRQYRRKFIEQAAESAGVSMNDLWPFLNTVHKPKRGTYDLTTLYEMMEEARAEQREEPEVTEEGIALKRISNNEVKVPAIDFNYVEWGHADIINKAVASRRFFPIVIHGESGNGKTISSMQACAKNNREAVRVQINPQTDEDDLLGGFRLIAGETIFAEGPVLTAMRKGAVVILDELDRGTNRIMCLQGILEGKPVLVKKTGELVYPAPGFTVIATMNTQGRGSVDGRYSAANIIDDAFLERFIITLEQKHPQESVEKRILKLYAKSVGVDDDVFIDSLVKFGQQTRDTGTAGRNSVSTRRLCHIIETQAIVNDDRKAVKLCMAKFDEKDAKAFFALYDAIRPDTEAHAQANAEADKRKERLSAAEQRAAEAAQRVLNT